MTKKSVQRALNVFWVHFVNLAGKKKDIYLHPLSVLANI